MTLYNFIYELLYSITVHQSSYVQYKSHVCVALFYITGFLHIIMTKSFTVNKYFFGHTTVYVLYQSYVWVASHKACYN